MNTLNDQVVLNCGQTLPNRVVLAPLTNKQSNFDGTLHQRELNWLTLRSGQFGLISTCATYISSEGKAWEGQLGIAEDKHIEPLKKLTGAVKSNGSKIITQLHHAGERATLSHQKISSTEDQENDVKAATIQDIHRITQDFVDAAIRAEKSGFDGIEVHGANGYIFTQFLSRTTNQRNDEYGGDIVNRARFLRETVQQIRKEVSQEFMVNVRISPVDTYSKRGLFLEDSLQVAKWLEQDCVDIISLSMSDATSEPTLEGTDVPVIAEFKSNSTGISKYAISGGIWDKQTAERVLELGADLVVLGKAAIVHPNWPSAIQDPDFTPIKPKWNPDIFDHVNVSKPFAEYLLKFPGLVEGGAPERGS